MKKRKRSQTFTAPLFCIQLETKTLSYMCVFLKKKKDNTFHIHEKFLVPVL